MKKCKQGYYYCYTDEKCKPHLKGFEDDRPDFLVVEENPKKLE